MFKKLLAKILVAVMIVGSLPAMAFAAGETPADKTLLIDAINNATALVNHEDYVGDYPVSQRANLDTVLVGAIAVRDDANATQAQVNAAIAEVVNARAMLTLKEPGRTPTPDVFTVKKPSTPEASDGGISGVNPAMEYKTPTGSGYVKVGPTMTHIMNLKQGSYLIRYAYTAARRASAPLSIQVMAEAAPTLGPLVLNDEYQVGVGLDLATFDALKPTVTGVIKSRVWETAVAPVTGEGSWSAWTVGQVVPDYTKDRYFRYVVTYGDTNTKVKSNEVKLKVKQNAITLKITASNLTGTVGTNIDFKATLTNSSNPTDIAGKEIRFNLQDGEGIPYSITNDKGVATFSATPTLAGDFVMTASYLDTVSGETIATASHTIKISEPPLEFNSVGEGVHNIKATSVDVKIITYRTAKVYVLSVPAGSQAPTKQAVKDAGVFEEVIVNQLHNYSVGGLTPSTNYDIYLLAEDATGMQSDLKKLTATTKADPTVPSFDPAMTRVMVGQTTTATLNVNSSLAGTVKYKVVPRSAAVPSVEDMMLSNLAMNVYPETNKIYVLENLTQGTLYDLYLIATSNGVHSALKKLQFGTDVAINIQNPVLNLAKNNVVSTSDTSVVLKLNSSTNGRIYLKSVTRGDTAPTKAKIVLDSNIAVTVADNDVNKTISELTAGTEYDLYAVAMAANGLLSGVIKLEFKTTGGVPVVVPPVVVPPVVVPPVVVPVVPPVVIPTPPSGGGGGGGGGSSSNDESAAKPSTPPSNNPATPIETPKPTSTKIDVTIGGVKESLGLMSTGVGKDGLTTTLVTPETQSFIDKIKKHTDAQLTKGQSNQKLDVSVIVPENSSSIKQAMIDSQSVKSLVSSSVNLKVDTQLGSIILSNEALKSIQKSNSETVSLMMSVQNALPSVKSNLETFMKARGSDLMTVSSEMIDFSMSALDLSGKTIVLDTFETFVSKTLKANKDLTTGVVLGGDGSFHTVPTFVEGRGTANIVGRINSLTNSNYTLIKVDRKFNDISGNKYEASILNLANRLIVEGTTQDAFNPSGKVTRAEFMTMVTKALGMYRGEMGKFKFDDMTAVSGLNIGISVAADKGLVKGYGNNILKPNQTITSEEMASILNNIVTKYATEKVDTVSGGVTVEGWYKEAVKQATAYGYIEDFKLGKEMTRAESAYAIEKLLKSLKLID